MKRLAPHPGALGCLLTVCAVWALALPAHAGPVSLRYQLEPGQRWTATQSTERETRIGDTTHGNRGVARFEYIVRADPNPERVRLAAVMLSQETDDGVSPFDFTVIRFRASTDPRGLLRGVHFQLGDVEPPELPGIERDPVAFRQMLRGIGEAWIDSVYWMPELPERPLAIGESFFVANRDDVGGTDPGVTMQLTSRTIYTLREVQGRTAQFGIVVRSNVDASTAQSEVASERVAEGEALFDLDLGMWTRQVTRGSHRARVRGANGGPSEVTARTVTTIEMAPSTRAEENAE